VLLLVLAVVLPVAGTFLASAVAVVGGTFGRTFGGLLNTGIVGVILVVFLVGPGVRLIRSADEPGAARRRQAERERLRRTPRRPAEDIPPYGERREPPPDEDPTVPLGEP
jgi:hypothetical protein